MNPDLTRFITKLITPKVDIEASSSVNLILKMVPCGSMDIWVLFLEMVRPLKVTSTSSSRDNVINKNDQ